MSGLLPNRSACDFHGCSGCRLAAEGAGETARQHRRSGSTPGTSRDVGGVTSGDSSSDDETLAALQATFASLDAGKA